MKVSPEVRELVRDELTWLGNFVWRQYSLELDQIHRIIYETLTSDVREFIRSQLVWLGDFLENYNLTDDQILQVISEMLTVSV